MTRLPLANIDLLPNYALRHAIHDWASRHGVTLEEPEAVPSSHGATNNLHPAEAPVHPVSALAWEGSLLEEAGNARLVVIDALGALSRGHNENSRAVVQVCASGSCTDCFWVGLLAPI